MVRIGSIVGKLLEKERVYTFFWPTLYTRERRVSSFEVIFLKYFKIKYIIKHNREKLEKKLYKIA